MTVVDREKRHVKPDIRAAVIELHGDGVGPMSIAVRLGIQHTQVQWVLASLKPRGQRVASRIALRKVHR